MEMAIKREFLRSLPLSNLHSLGAPRPGGMSASSSVRVPVASRRTSLPMRTSSATQVNRRSPTAPAGVAGPLTAPKVDGFGPLREMCFSTGVSGQVVLLLSDEQVVPVHLHPLSALFSASQ